MNTAEIDSLLSWWRDAGVDTLVDEVARPWLAAAPSPRPPIVSGPLAVAAPMPGSVSGFADWLMSSAAPADAGPSARRVAPRGPEGGLMILTDMPELEDIDAGALLSGAIAPLFDAMLAALGRDRTAVYIASLNPGRTPNGRLSTETLEGWAAIARHHIGLVAPKQLWLLGDAARRAILGLAEAQAHGKLHEVNLDGVMIDAIATSHPKLLLDQPERKKRTWTDMQRLMKAGEA